MRNAFRNKTPEQKSLDSLKSRMKNRDAELKEKIAREEFETPKRQEIQLDGEGRAIEAALELTKDKYMERVMETRLRNQLPVERGVRAAFEVVHFSRAVITSLDFSAIGRQGGIIGLSNPARVKAAVRASIEALRSEVRQKAVELELKRRPNSKLYKKAELFIADQKGGITALEEAYMSRHAGKVPIVAGSQRAFVSYLNRLRADSFDVMLDTLTRNGKKAATVDEMKIIANYINVATGRGRVSGSMAGAMAFLSQGFFAPRLVVSRFQYILGQPMLHRLGRGSPRARLLIAKEYAKFATGLSLVYGLALGAGATVQWDPRSSDFGKLKIGNTRIDVLAGLSQGLVFGARFASGETKDLARGKVRPIEGVGARARSSFAKTRKDLTLRFIRTKAAPTVGAFIDWIDKKDVLGNPFTPEGAVADLIIPLVLHDMWEAMKLEGLDAGTAYGIVAALGYSTQSFEARKRRNKRLKPFPRRVDQYIKEVKEVFGLDLSDWKRSFSDVSEEIEKELTSRPEGKKSLFFNDNLKEPAKSLFFNEASP